MLALSSAKKKMIVPIIFLCFLCSPLHCFGDDLIYQPDYLNIPMTEFLSSVKMTIDVLQQVTSIVAGFSRAFLDFRLSNAISDCLDLLELSSDELVSTLLLTQNPHNSKFFFTIVLVIIYIWTYRHVKHLLKLKYVMKLVA